MQIVHGLTKKPTMGDRRIAGRGESLEFADFSLKINQGRHQVDSGGKMTQQRLAIHCVNSLELYCRIT